MLLSRLPPGGAAGEGRPRAAWHMDNRENTSSKAEAPEDAAGGFAQEVRKKRRWLLLSAVGEGVRLALAYELFRVPRRFLRFGRLGPEDYALMKKAGFRLVLFGVESANQSTLDRLAKGLRTEDVEQGAAWASKAGLAVHLTFMFGYPWEGPAEMANTVRLARRLLANGHAATLQCTLTIPYPGTPLFRELQAGGGLATLDWDEYDQRRAVREKAEAAGRGTSRHRMRLRQ